MSTDSNPDEPSGLDVHSSLARTDVDIRRDADFPRIPGYRLETVVGRGSVATVYCAVQIGMNRTVAIKVLRSDVLRDDRTADRLLREARLVARLNHPHVVRAHDAGLHDGIVYFVMELVDGFSVREFIERDGPFSESETLRIAIDMAEALRHLHRESIVHRDIKPANVLVDSEGKALLADLGLAKPQYDTSTTSEGRAVGTPQYMAPEQAMEPETVDSRSDMFSLGATLYHMATGVSPFAAPTVGAVITKILYEEVPSMREHDATLSPGFAAVVARLLTKQRADRYETPSVLLADLVAVERGARPPVAMPSAGDPVMTTAERRRRSLVVGLGGLGVLFAIIAVVMFIVSRGRRDASEGEAGEAARPADEVVRVAGLSPIEAVATLRRDDLEPASRVALRRDIDRDLEAAADLARDEAGAAVTAGRSAAARRRVREEFVEDLRALFGADPATYPEWLRGRVEAQRTTLSEYVSGRIRTWQETRVEAAVAALATRVDELASEAEFRSEADVAAELTDVGVAESQGLDDYHGRRIETARRDAVREFDRRRRLDFAERLREIDAHRRAFEFRSARGRLEALELLHPSRLDVSFVEEIQEASRRTLRDERRLRGELVDVLATLDRLATPGYSEWKDRDFTSASTALQSRLSKLPDDLAELGEAQAAARRLADIEAVVDGARQWIDQAPARLLRNVGPVRLSLRDGTILTGTLHERDAGRWVVTTEAGDERDFSPGDLSSQGLASLFDDEDAAASRRIESFLDYCDDAFSRVERRAAEDADSFLDWLAVRAVAARAELFAVVTDEDRSAFDAWSVVMQAYRESRWERARLAAKAFAKQRAFTTTAWYRHHEESIRRVMRELESRASIAGVVGPRAGAVEIVDLARRRVRIRYAFDVAAELDDLVVRPGGAEVTGGALRVFGDKNDVAPSTTPAESVPFPVDPTRPFRLDLVVRFDPRHVPRCLTVSMFGCHVSFLGRLRRRAAVDDRELHGLERDLFEFVDFGLVTHWTGRLDDYEKAFSRRLGGPPRVLFEAGRAYLLRFHLDPSAGTLRVAVDGRRVLDEKIDFRPRDQLVSVRAAKPHEILEIVMDGAVLTR